MAKSIAITFGTEGVDASTIKNPSALRALARRAIGVACEHGLEPDLSAPHPRHRVSLMTHLTDSQYSYLSGLIKKQGASAPIAAAAGRLADAGHRIAIGQIASAAAGPANTLDELIAVLGLGKRDEQMGLYRMICDTLEQADGTGLVAAQGSTGVGKTTVAQAVAIDWLRGNLNAAPNGVTVVAFPSLHGVKTFASQWQMARTRGMQLPPVAVLMGRREFASLDAIELLLADPLTRAPNLSGDDISTVQQWLNSQGDARPIDESPVGPWRIDTLLDLVGGLDRESLSINSLSSSSDPGVVAYQEQFLRARGASIVACSHHMLAFDLLLRQQAVSRGAEYREERSAIRSDYFSSEAKDARQEAKQAGGRSHTISEIVAQLALDHERALQIEGLSLDHRRLPPYQHLIVDEAHLLEQAFSSCYSSSISLRETARKLAALAKLDGRKEVREAASAAHAACLQISSGAKDNEVTSFEPQLAMEGQAVTALRTIAWALKQFKPKKNAKDDTLPLLASLERDARVIEAALSTNYSSVRLLDFSPVRQYPNLVVGNGNVSQPLHMLWAGVRSAVLLSATLYMRRSDGWSARYVANLQSIPGHRLKEIPVVEAPWLTTPVQGLYVPASEAPSVVQGGLPWLMPPSRRHRIEGSELIAAQDAWLEDVGNVIRRVYATAAGGVLVPCTSHETVHKLAELLRKQRKDQVESGDLVLASTDYPSVGALRQAGVEAGRRGERFIMLGTGALWTGFDLSGQELGLASADDNLLTDLVLPRLPFGMNRSITHRRRMADKRDPVNHEVMSVALLVQQALGRLVRRPGLLRNRRIFLLDARLGDPSLKGWIAPVRRVFDQYPCMTIDRASLGLQPPGGTGDAGR